MLRSLKQWVNRNNRKCNRCSPLECDYEGSRAVPFDERDAQALADYLGTQSGSRLRKKIINIIFEQSYLACRTKDTSQIAHACGHAMGLDSLWRFIETHSRPETFLQQTQKQEPAVSAELERLRL